MGLRFRKSINLGGGFRINLSKSGIGYSYGVKGLRYTKTAKGKERMTASIPGTGLSWSTEAGKDTRKKRASSVSTSTAPAPAKPADKYKMPLIPNILLAVVGIALGEFYYFSQEPGYLPSSAGTESIVIAGLLMGLAFYAALYGIFRSVFKTMGIGMKKYSEEIPKTKTPDQSEALHETAGELQEESFDLPGTHYHKASIAKVADINPDWRKTCKALINAGKENKKIYRFLRTTKKAELVKEPDNPHDKNAVMVLVDGEKVGYISADENLHVIDIMDSGAIEEVSATISGGSYKIVYSEDEIKKGESGPYVEVKVKYKG